MFVTHPHQSTGFFKSISRHLLFITQCRFVFYLFFFFWFLSFRPESIQCNIFIRVVLLKFDKKWVLLLNAFMLQIKLFKPLSFYDLWNYELALPVIWIFLFFVSGNNNHYVHWFAILIKAVLEKRNGRE